MIVFLQVIHILICSLLVGVILMQSGKGQGLSGSFGSFAGGAAQNVFGARTGDALTKITTGLAIAFFLSAVGTAIIQSKSSATVLKSYKAPVATTPTQSAENMKEKLNELTQNLLKKSEQKKDSLPTSVEPTPTPTTVDVKKTETTPAPAGTPAASAVSEDKKTENSIPSVEAKTEAKIPEAAAPAEK